MTASPSVTPAGGFVLPADTERWDDLVSCSMPHGDLISDQDLGIGVNYKSVVMLTCEGKLEVQGATYSGLKEVSSLNSDFCQKIHVLRPPHSGSMTFHEEEVETTFANNPWLRHQWFRDNFLRWVELLPRPSETVPGAVAYFQNLDKRARNIRTPIKPGRFLKKYFGDILSEVQIHELAHEWGNAADLKTLKITQDADEIETIYKARHFGSCMQFSNDGYDGPCHPARVYAGPDLAIAYIGSVDQPQARCVVWPDKKIHTSIYGDEARMEAALEAAGFRDPNSYSPWHGARLQRIETRGGKFVLPYLDMAEGVDDYDDYLRIGGSIGYDGTSGVSDDSHVQRCDDCNDRMTDDERNYISSCDRDVCDHCYTQRYFYCEGSSESYPDDRRANTSTNDGYNYSLDHVEYNSNHWFECEGTNTWYLKSETDYVVDIHGTYYTLEYAARRGYHCEYSEEWFVNEDEDFEVKLDNHTSVNMNSFRNREDFDEYLSDIGAGIKTLPNENQYELQLETPEQEAA
jgi:hypothetical protein